MPARGVGQLRERVAVALRHLDGASDALDRERRLIGVHERRVDEERRHTCRKKVGDGGNDVERHAVVQMAAPEGVSGYGKREALAILEEMRALAARAGAHCWSHGPWLMSRQCSQTMSSWVPDTVIPSGIDVARPRSSI